MTERFTPFAATHAIVTNQDQEILMLRRYETGWMDGLYTVPAGHIDERESATDAAIRELEEETGLIANPTTSEHAITVHRQDEEGVIYFDNYFVFPEWSGEPTIAEPDKSDAIEWMHIDNLGDNVVPTVLRALQAHLKGLRYLEDGWNQ